MGEFVRLEVADGVGAIRLDRPPAADPAHPPATSLRRAWAACAFW